MTLSTSMSCGGLKFSGRQPGLRCCCRASTWRRSKPSPSIQTRAGHAFRVRTSGDRPLHPFVRSLPDLRHALNDQLSWPILDFLIERVLIPLTQGVVSARDIKIYLIHIILDNTRFKGHECWMVNVHGCHR